MQIFPIAFLPFILTCISLGLYGRKGAYIAACTALPFGAMATISASGTNLLAEQLTFICVGSIFFADQAYRVHVGRALKLEVEVLVISLLCVYACISALLMPHLFRGILVFSPTLAGENGIKYSNDVAGAWLNFLRPTMGNFTQTAYLIFAALVFVYSLNVGREYGYKILDKAIFIAGVIHGVLGLADIIGLDAVLGIFRTASYRINDSHQVLGLDRTIGGMVEASRYGIMAGILFAYFFGLWLMNKQTRDLVLSGLIFITGVSTLSSSAFAAIGSTLVILGLRIYSKRRNRRSGKAFGIIVLSCSLAIVLILIFTSAGELAQGALHTLIFDKVSTDSGQIRSATALQSLRNLQETWFLGAGAGSVTSNGLLFVWLGNLGILGTVLFVMFFWLAIKAERKPHDQTDPKYAYWFAATTALGALLFSEGISRTLLDPGVFTMVITALAVSTRRPVLVRI